jgi:hypothetical protein
MSNHRKYKIPSNHCMSMNHYRHVVKQEGVYISVYPGSMSPNWDGSWWTVEWSDGDHEHIETTTNRHFDGLRYCRQKATEAAFLLRAGREGITII